MTEKSETPTHPLRLTPSSSNILGLEYHEPDKVLTVHFRNGGVYRHQPVPIVEFTGLLAAESVGKHYAAHIRGKYESTKIESGAAPAELKNLTAHFRDHVKALETTAISDLDESRRLEAARSLAAICLLMEGWRPDGGDPDGGGEEIPEGAEVVNLALWRNSLAA